MIPVADAARGRGLFDLDHHLDFDEGAERQRVDAERGARVTAAVTEHGDEQVGAAVHDLGLILKIVGAVNEAADAHDALHLGEVADFAFERGEQGKGGLFGGGGGIFLGGAATHFARNDLAGGVAWNVAGEEDQIAGAHGGHVVGHGRVGGRQGEPELRNFFLGSTGERGRGEDNGGQQGEAEWAGRHGDVSVRADPAVAS